MNSFLTGPLQKRGLLYGLLGTLLMSLIMLIGMGTGLSPIPQPIPLAIVTSVLDNIAQPLLIIFAIFTHFGYGAFWGAVLFRVVKKRGQTWHGLAMGLFLWFIMELLVLPWLGWGVFGSAITPKIAVATLALHLGVRRSIGLGFKQDLTSNR
ncbi:hypothetical protein [Fodinibius sp.]|uniref:hypothetical protein n=1 Tax=Fodinibius sp. TaxID=1872440 RepID=UPI002ACEBF53|nr:hypothetical protein [Fodinibius sp.]MDZ7659394.1 hypothetical protein [Fodinibius sp.]